MRERIHPRKKSVLTAAAAVLITVLVFSGCASLNPFKPSVLSLTKDAVTNFGKVRSGTVEYTVDSDLALGSKGLDISLDMQLDVEGHSEFTRDPDRTKTDATVRVNVLGQEQTFSTEGYTDKLEDGTTVTYSRMEGGEWYKTTTPPEENEDGEGSSGTGIDPLTLGGGLLKMAIDNPLGAELLEEMSSVHGKEAYQINCTIPGSILKEAIENMDNKNADKIAELTKDIDWDAVEIPAELYIYKENKLPARIYLDCKTIGTQFIQVLLNQMGGELPLDQVSIDARTLTVDIIIDDYDEIAPIEIPQEALDAKEMSSEEGLSGLGNLF
jgi:hypothetical protein